MCTASCFNLYFLYWAFFFLMVYLQSGSWVFVQLFCLFFNGTAFLVLILRLFLQVREANSIMYACCKYFPLHGLSLYSLNSVFLEAGSAVSPLFFRGLHLWCCCHMSKAILLSFSLASRSFTFRSMIPFR